MSGRLIWTAWSTVAPPTIIPAINTCCWSLKIPLRPKSTGVAMTPSVSLVAAWLCKWVPGWVSTELVVITWNCVSVSSASPSVKMVGTWLEKVVISAERMLLVVTKEMPWLWGYTCRVTPPVTLACSCSNPALWVAWSGGCSGREFISFLWGSTTRMLSLWIWDSETVKKRG